MIAPSGSGFEHAGRRESFCAEFACSPHISEGGPSSPKTYRLGHSGSFVALNFL